MHPWRDHIESKPEILFGKPVFKNTRIPVDLILEKLSQGEDVVDLLDAYPTLSKADILAALAFASETVRNEIVHSLAS